MRDMLGKPEQTSAVKLLIPCLDGADSPQEFLIQLRL
jgi:hypothetical protein